MLRQSRSSSDQDLLVAPRCVKLDRLPDPLVNDGQPASVKNALDTYFLTQRNVADNDEITSKYEYDRFTRYPRILQADREFQAEYESPTTALLTRCISLDSVEAGNITPWEINDMLHGGGVNRPVKNSFRYHLENFEFEYVAVTAPSQKTGIPREYIYLWIDDPDDEISGHHLKNARDKHLKHCEAAKDEDHEFREDGSGGAIRWNTCPSTVDYEPEKMESILSHSEGLDIYPTRGAYHIASELPHLQLGDHLNSGTGDVPDEILFGGLTAWISPYKWFKASSGVPQIQPN